MVLLGGGGGGGGGEGGRSLKICGMDHTRSSS